MIREPQMIREIEPGSAWNQTTYCLVSHKIF